MIKTFNPEFKYIHSKENSSKLNILYRLVQNRKSAQKCRLKKKAEFVTMKDDIKKLAQENKDLKEKVSVFCLKFLFDIKLS